MRFYVVETLCNVAVVKARRFVDSDILPLAVKSAEMLPGPSIYTLASPPFCSFNEQQQKTAQKETGAADRKTNKVFLIIFMFCSSWDDNQRQLLCFLCRKGVLFCRISKFSAERKTYSAFFAAASAALYSCFYRNYYYYTIQIKKTRHTVKKARAKCCPSGAEKNAEPPTARRLIGGLYKKAARLMRGRLSFAKKIGNLLQNNCIFAQIVVK